MFTKKFSESLPTPANSVKGKELAYGRAKATTTIRRDALALAQAAHARAEAAAGEAMADGTDPGPLAGVLEDAERGLRLAQVALNISTQRETEAEGALRVAKRLAVLDAERQALIRLKVAVGKADDILLTLEGFCERELVPAMNACLVAGAPGAHNSFLKDLHLWWPQFVTKACHAMNPKGDPGLVTRVNRPFSSYVPDVEQHLAARAPNE